MYMQYIIQNDQLDCCQTTKYIISSLLKYISLLFHLFFPIGYSFNLMLNGHHKKIGILSLANQRAQFPNEKSAKFQKQTWSVFYGLGSFIQSSNADGRK